MPDAEMTMICYCGHEAKDHRAWDYKGDEVGNCRKCCCVTWHGVYRMNDPRRKREADKET